MCGFFFCVCVSGKYRKLSFYYILAITQEPRDIIMEILINYLDSLKIGIFFSEKLFSIFLVKQINRKIWVQYHLFIILYTASVCLSCVADLLRIISTAVNMFDQTHKVGVPLTPIIIINWGTVASGTVAINTVLI